MIANPVLRTCGPTLLRMIEDHVRLTTGNRVRGLTLQEQDGRVVVRGQAPTQHTKQLALHAVLEFLSGDELHEQIVVA